MVSASNHTKRGVIFSDSHFLGQNWKQCAHRLSSEHLDGLCRNADIAVLNGDIFDYDHSGMRADEWLDKAEATVRGWMGQYPSCEFHYVLGNHDEYELWHKRLSDISKDFEGRLQVHTDSLRIGDNLFVHGDYCGHERELLPRSYMAERYRQEKNQEPPHMLFEPQNPQDRLQGLLSALKEAGQLQGVSHIFAGHLHHSAIDIVPEGYPELHYHNTGSAVAGASFTPLLFDLDKNNEISNVRPARPFELVPPVGMRL